MKQKKRDLEDWEKAECAALKAAIEARNRSLPKNERITQEQAGASLGMNQGSFSNYLNGRLALNLEFALKVSKLFGIPIADFSPRLAKAISPPDTQSDLDALAPFFIVEYKDPNNDVGLGGDGSNILSQFKKSTFSLNEHNPRVRTRVLSSSKLTPYAESTLTYRLHALTRRIEHLIEDEEIDDGDFDLLNSMLDRIDRKSSNISRDRDERIEKH